MWVAVPSNAERSERSASASAFGCQNARVPAPLVAPGVRWLFYPRSDACPDGLTQVARVFEKHYTEISSHAKTKSDALNSNAVLASLADSLLSDTGFTVELGKQAKSKIAVPVLYGLRGSPTKSYEVDGWNPSLKAVLEVEAGQAVTNFKFLKDLFEACVMDSVDYLILAVQNWYYSAKRDDFVTVSTWLDVAYASGRFTLPLRGILLIGY